MALGSNSGCLDDPPIPCHSDGWAKRRKEESAVRPVLQNCNSWTRIKRPGPRPWPVPKRIPAAKKHLAWN